VRDKHRYFVEIEQAAQERRVADLVAGIEAAVTRNGADEVLEFPRTQKVLSKLRDHGAIKDVWKILRGTLQHSPKYDDFDHYFRVCARLQEILMQIDQQPLAIPGLGGGNHLRYTSARTH
jgi:kynureninase